MRRPKLQAEGDHEAARPLYERALAIDETVSRASGRTEVS